MLLLIEQQVGEEQHCYYSTLYKVCETFSHSSCFAGILIKRLQIIGTVKKKHFKTITFLNIQTFLIWHH